VCVCARVCKDVCVFVEAEFGDGKSDTTLLERRLMQQLTATVQVPFTLNCYKDYKRETMGNGSG